MDSAVVKGLDRAQLKTLRTMYRQDAGVRALREAKEILENPIIEYALGTLFIGYVFGVDNEDSWQTKLAKSLSAGAMGVQLTGIISLQQLGKSLPVLANTPAVSGLIGGLLK